MAQQLPPAKGLIFNKSEVNVGGVVVQFSDMAAHTAVRVLIGGTAMPLVSARVTCDLAADLWRHMVALPGAFAV
jgi:predicted solute-binding protein